MHTLNGMLKSLWVKAALDSRIPKHQFYQRGQEPATSSRFYVHLVIGANGEPQETHKPKN